MAIGMIMQGYTKIGSIYLREDQQAVGYVSPKGLVGLLRIEPESRNKFNGRGITFADSSAEHAKRRFQSLFESQKGPRGFGIRPSHINEFIESENGDQHDPASYLFDLVEEPCIQYALATPRNRVRSFAARLNLQYNPFKSGERRKMYSEVGTQMNEAVDELICMIGDIATQFQGMKDEMLQQLGILMTSIGFDMGDYRALGDFNFQNVLRDKEALKRKLLSMKMKPKYESFRGEATYEITARFTEFSGTSNSITTQIFNKNGNTKRTSDNLRLSTKTRIPFSSLFSTT